VWYAWNPLAVVEVAGSGHFEPLALLPLVAAAALAPAARARGWAAFAASLGAKYAGVVALPAFVRHARPRARAILAAAMVLVPPFALYELAGWLRFDSLRAYAENWRYNDFAFAWLRMHVQDPLVARRIAGGATLALAVACGCAARSLAGGATGA